jgi:predicted neutral ceramidase superfamily lipid hydrolase
VTNRALPYSISNDILRIVLYRGLVRRIVSLPKESLGRLVTDFFKTFKIVDFRRDFCISEVFAVLLGRVLVTILLFCFRSTLVVFIFV